MNGTKNAPKYESLVLRVLWMLVFFFIWHRLGVLAVFTPSKNPGRLPTGLLHGRQKVKRLTGQPPTATRPSHETLGFAPRRSRAARPA